MSYGSIAQVRIGTGFNDVTNIPDATVQTALDYASALIDAKVGQQYTLPLSVGGTPTTPDLIDGLANECASAIMYMDEYGEESQDTDKGWEKKWNKCFEVCDMILKGELKLFDPSTGEEYDKSNQLNPVFSPNDNNSAAGESAEPFLTMHQQF